DDILMTVMLWRLDTGDIAGALEIARYALKYGLTMPGTRVVQLMARGGRYEKAGHTITGLRIIGEVDGDDEAIFRPIQKYINGTWYNVAQV
ncbi:phage terminase small subunit, partial [Escherichia coli]|nr:phage terminase small subunit [Escherichia coli]